MGSRPGDAVSEEQLRLLIDSIRDYAIFMVDPHGCVATWNVGAEAIKGYSSEEIIGKHLATFYTQEDRDAQKPNRLLQIAASEGRVEEEGWRVRRDGTRFWAEVVITAIRRPAGELVGFATVNRDLTKRREAEQRLKLTQETLSATLYSIGDGVLATDDQSRITIINTVAEHLTGWSEREAMGRPVQDVFHIVNEETRAKAFNPIDRVLKEGVVVGLANHTALIARDGTERPIADSGAPIRDADGRTRGAVLVFRDVTEERRAQDVLRQSEETLRLMIASVHDYAIFLLDPVGHVATWNPGAERIKGYRADEIIGAHFSRFFTPEDVEARKPELELESAARDGRFEVETWRVRKDGSHFWANVVISAVRDENGKLRGFTKVTRDLTERRKADEERFRLAQTREAVRLRDEFLSIASHELRTPLTALQLQLHIVSERFSGDEALGARIHKALRAGGRLADLIETLMDVSRIATGRLELRFETFDLVVAAREVGERLRDSATQAGCALSFEGDASVVGTWDRLRVEQLVTNLVANAIKYAPGAPIVVTVRKEDGDGVLEIRDRGPGIREDALARIFERFERAAAPGSGGMGLGLYVARQITEAHRGSITANNVDGTARPS